MTKRLRRSVYLLRPSMSSGAAAVTAGSVVPPRACAAGVGSRKLGPGSRVASEHPARSVMLPPRSVRPAAVSITLPAVSITLPAMRVTLLARGIRVARFTAAAIRVVVL